MKYICMYTLQNKSVQLPISPKMNLNASYGLNSDNDASGLGSLIITKGLLWCGRL